MNRSELKQKAKESLKGKYLESIKLYLLLFLICIGVSVVFSIFEVSSESMGAILGLVSSGIIYGFYAGFYSFFLKISRNEEVSCNELFKKLNLFWITIGATLISSIFSGIGVILFIIPGIIIALNYSMIYFVIVDNPEIGIMDALRKSKEIMKGHRVEYIVLNLSFLGWYILCFFTLGILLLWLAPYMLVTTANFYNQIKD